MTTQQHDCREELREISLKATPARVAILQLLERADAPLDITTIGNYLQKHKIKADPATIFRVINSFTKNGLTKQVYFNEGKARYELSAKEEHHHFICENCGSVIDISDCNISLLEKDIAKKKGLLIKKHSLEFFGLCSLCQS